MLQEFDLRFALDRQKELALASRSEQDSANGLHPNTLAFLGIAAMNSVVNAVQILQQHRVELTLAQAALCDPMIMGGIGMAGGVIIGGKIAAKLGLHDNTKLILGSAGIGALLGYQVSLEFMYLFTGYIPPTPKFNSQVFQYIPEQ